MKKMRIEAVTGLLLIGVGAYTAIHEHEGAGGATWALMGAFMIGYGMGLDVADRAEKRAIQEAKVTVRSLIALAPADSHPSDLSDRFFYEWKLFLHDAGKLHESQLGKQCPFLMWDVLSECRHERLARWLRSSHFVFCGATPGAEDSLAAIHICQHDELYLDTGKAPFRAASQANCDCSEFVRSYSFGPFPPRLRDSYLDRID